MTESTEETTANSPSPPPAIARIEKCAVLESSMIYLNA